MSEISWKLTGTRDPRIDEFVERIGEVDSKGNPTRVADMARRVKDYLVEIEKLRSEVDIATRQVVYLAGREQAMVKNTQQFMATRISSVQQILDTYLNSTSTELNASAVAVEGTTIKRKKIIRRRRILRRRKTPRAHSPSLDPPPVSRDRLP